MEKINITLDLSKINKAKITDRSYENGEGKTVTAKEYKVVVVPLKEEKVLATGDTWTMVKTHFVADEQTKEEREAGEKTNYVGEGITFRNKSEGAPSSKTEYPEGDDNEIPF